MGVPPLVTTGPTPSDVEWAARVAEVAKPSVRLDAPNVIARSRSALARIPAPEAVGSVLVDGWARADDYARSLSVLLDIYKAQPGSDDLSVASGLDYLPKAVLENGAAPGWFVPTVSVLSPMDVSQHLHPDVSDELASRAEGLQPRVTVDYPVKSNHGWPDAASTLDSLDAHIGLAAVCRAEGPDAAAALAATAAATTFPACSLIWRRTGPRGKPLPYWVSTSEGLAVGGNSLGAYCYSRPVYGAPAWLNLSIVPEAEVATQRVKAAAPHVFRHKTADLTAWRQTYRPGYIRGQDDLTRYDETQSLELQDDAADLIGRISGSARCADILKWAIRLPVVYPPLFGLIGVTLLRKLSGLASGLRVTSLTGGIVNFDRVCQAYASIFSEPVRLWAIRFLDGVDPVTGETFVLMIQGDDTAWEIPARYEVDEETWKKENLKRGFLAKPRAGFAFLATAYEDDGTHYGIAARAAGRTGYRESTPSSIFQELVGLFSRWTRCFDDPMAPVCWDIAIRPRLRMLNIPDMALSAFLAYGRQHFKLWAASLAMDDLLDETIGLAGQGDYDALRSTLVDLGVDAPLTDSRRITIHLSRLTDADRGARVARTYLEAHRFQIHR